MNPLFTTELIYDKLAEFNLSTIPDLTGKQAVLATWIAQLRTGKLAKQKEEAVKSRFVADVFEKVLGFSANRTHEWQLEEEKHTSADKTKADAALGFFTGNPSTDIHRAAIEMKGAATDLDKKQPRRQTQSAISQAFEYAAKMGPECRWVIVSNLREIRFYYHTDYNRYQRYRLDELDQEDCLKEFLFLFHQDRFLVRQGESKTEKLLARTAIGPPIRPVGARHIVAEMEDCLAQFAGLQFVDPHYLAALPPFNILSQHVWHYQQGTLFTINPALCRVIESVRVEQGQLRVSEELAQELQAAGIGHAEQRLTKIFQFLNHCYIVRFRAVRDYEAIERRNARTIGFNHRHTFSFKTEEGVDKKIFLLDNLECPCPQCRFRRLDLNDFLGWLKSSTAHSPAEQLNLAYGHYLAATNGFKEAYELYSQLEQQAEARQERGIPYFLARYNRLRLHNLIEGHYGHADSEELLADLRTIDLVTVVTDEIGLALSRPARDYLLKIIDDQLLRRAEHQVQDTIEELRERRQLLRRGGMFNGPDYLTDVGSSYSLLYLHINRNFLVADTFTDYRKLARRTLQAVLLDYTTPELGHRRIASLYLEEAVFYLNPSDLEKLLAGTRRLRTGRVARQALLTKLSKLLQSCYTNNVFGDPKPNSLVQEFLHQYHFEDRLTNIFSNLLVLLSHLRIREGELGDIPAHLLAFLGVEEMLAHHDITRLATFIKRQGQLFGEAHLVQLLKLTLLESRGNRLRYYKLIHPLTDILHAHFPTYKLTDLTLLRQAFAACDLHGRRQEGLRQLANLVQLTDEAGTTYLRQRFEAQLAEEFDADLYQHLLWRKAVPLPSAEEDDSFRQLVEYTNRSKGVGFKGFLRGKPDYQDFYLHNFALLVYDKQLDFRRPELALLTRLSDFERWLMNPVDFDYAQFDVNWLRALYGHRFFSRLRGIQPLVRALQAQLDRTYSPELYRLYSRHFSSAAPASPALNHAQPQG
jgi:hypothetical protein